MKRITNRQINITFIIANIITQILFFIDEGYYDFRWVKSWGNWVVYVIYVSVIWGLSLGLRFVYNLLISIIQKSRK